jgi:hypothetical protein
MSFYSANEIDSLLICKHCEQKFEDPRILPCGKSFCNSCIVYLADTNNTNVNCKNCGKKHEIPKDGFLPNLDLVEIMKVKSDQVIRSKLSEEFKSVTAMLKEKSEHIQLDLEIGDTTIRNHCDKVRDEVQLCILESQEKLDKILAQFLDKIDDYEKNCQANFKKIRQNKAHFEDAIKESNQFLSKSIEILNQVNVDESKLKASLEEANLLLKSLEKIDDELRSQMFAKKNLSNYDQIDLELVAADLESGSGVWFLPFKNSNFICAFLNKTNNVNLYKLDGKGNVLIETKNVIQGHFNNDLSVKIVDDLIYVSSSELIKCFDENLYFIKELSLDDGAEMICNSYGNLSTFCEGKHGRITTYNSNFDVLNHVDIDGKLRFLGNFFFPIIECQFLSRILITNTSFIIQDYDDEDVNEDGELNDDKRMIIIINKHYGIVEAFFYIECFNSWLYYLDKYLVTFDAEKLRTYDLKGRLLSEKSLHYSFQNAYLVAALNKRICFACDCYNDRRYPFYNDPKAHKKIVIM